jgi:hypothetical protein
LAAGLLGAAVTQEVARAVPNLPAGAGTLAYWVVLTGGAYKGFASALNLIENSRKQNREH